MQVPKCVNNHGLRNSEEAHESYHDQQGIIRSVLHLPFQKIISVTLVFPLLPVKNNMIEKFKALLTGHQWKKSKKYVDNIYFKYQHNFIPIQ